MNRCKSCGFDTPFALLAFAKIIEARPCAGLLCRHGRGREEAPRRPRREARAHDGGAAEADTTLPPPQSPTIPPPVYMSSQSPPASPTTSGTAIAVVSDTPPGRTLQAEARLCRGASLSAMQCGLASTPSPYPEGSVGWRAWHWGSLRSSDKMDMAILPIAFAPMPWKGACWLASFHGVLHDGVMDMCGITAERNKNVP